MINKFRIEWRKSKKWEENYDCMKAYAYHFNEINHIDSHSAHSIKTPENPCQIKSLDIASLAPNRKLDRSKQTSSRRIASNRSRFVLYSVAPIDKSNRISNNRTFDWDGTYGMALFISIRWNHSKKTRLWWESKVDHGSIHSKIDGIRRCCLKLIDLIRFHDSIPHFANANHYLH